MTKFRLITKSLFISFLITSPLLATSMEDSFEDQIKKLAVQDWATSSIDDSSDYLLENMELINHLDDHYSNLLFPKENDSKENNTRKKKSPFAMFLGDCTQILPAIGDKLVLELERNAAYIFPTEKRYKKDDIVEIVRLFAVFLQKRRQFATCAIIHADTFFSKGMPAAERIKNLKALITLEEEYVEAYLKGYNAPTGHKKQG